MTYSVLITGSSGSVGVKLIDGFLAQGWNIVTTDIVAPIKHKTIPFYNCDLKKQKETEVVYSNIFSEHGTFDALVNCCGKIHSEPAINFHDNMSLHSEKSFLDCFSSNFITTLNSSLVFSKLQIMNRVPASSILNFSSVSAKGMAGQIAYSSAKGGIESLTLSLAREFAHFGLRFNAIEPGFFDVDSTNEALQEHNKKQIKSKTLLGSFGSIEELSKLVVSIVENRFLTGQVIRIDGGFNG
jgi:3-oxoacyl-[acyl-carrier protein] reductase